MRRAAVAVAAALLLLLVTGAAAGHPEPTCPRGAGPPFLDALGPRCPRIARIAPSPPLEVRGDAVDKELNLRCGGASCSILFYAAWCPFSSKFRPIFEALSTMFPQIHHFAVEESSSMPRYGIRGFPAILLVNGTSMVRYRGTKDLKSLMYFYEETTGLDPVTYIDVDQQEITGSLGSVMPGGRSLRKMVKDEPFVFLGALFIILKAVAHFVPTVISHLRAFLIARVQNLNLRIRRVSSQLMERALTVLDVKRLWSNLRLSSKTRDLRKGASNARAWASSFASVSLGEPSSLRHA